MVARRPKQLKEFSASTLLIVGEIAPILCSHHACNVLLLSLPLILKSGSRGDYFKGILLPLCCLVPGVVTKSGV